ncbi:MAG: polyhydroxyalkanoate synthesis repressor PhaR, partial [Proteobacteria bacterium]|nr:polyhydroxyalkanoate synthesis repressor PhaR [Pseudomonadota bacterium]
GAAGYVALQRGAGMMGSVRRTVAVQHAGKNMSDPRVIKKYPNRRLYDTVESRYITLADIRRLVTDKIEFVVIDKKSQEDITRSILLQVIAEQEHQGDPLMSQDFLAQVIRAYGGTMPAMVGDYLEQSLKLFTAQQSQIRDRVRSMVGMDPMAAMSNLAQENFQRWRQMQETFFSSMAGAPGTRPAGDDKND